MLPFRFYAQKVAVEIEEMKILVDIAKILSKERSCMRIVLRLQILVLIYRNKV